MSFKILAVGKIKEAYLREGIEEYQKRLRSWLSIEIVELKESKSKNVSEALQEEGGRILKRLRPDAFKIILSPEGKKNSSVQMATEIEKLFKNGQSDLDIVIGGHEGLSPAIKKNADLLLSLSDMTFSSRLSRLILMEQLYRCMKIIKKEPYHR